MSTRVVVVVQARLGSSRLPGKVLMDVAGAPLLSRMIDRLRAARAPSGIVVATTWLEEDAPIVDLCRAIDVRCHRGHPLNLLERHVGAAREAQADLVAKIPSDCPLIGPEVVDRVLGEALRDPSRWDYVGNLHPGSWPDGNDVEVMPLPLLELADREATRQLDREHTTPFFWDQPERFRVANVAWERGVDFSTSHRWTVDSIEDLRFVQRVFAELLPSGPAFSVEDVLALLDRDPGIALLNASHAGKAWYRDRQNELRTLAGPPETTE